MSENKTKEGADNSESRNSPPERVLKLEYENAKQRLNSQNEIIKSFSKEGTRYFRLILVLVGVPVALLGAFDPATLSQANRLILSNECMLTNQPCIPIRYVTIAGFTLLLITASMNIGAGGYEAYNTRNISNPNDIDDTISSDRSTSCHLENRLKQYKERIEHNDEVIFSLDRILIIGKISLTYALFTLSLVAYRLAVGPTASGLELLAVVIFYALSFMIIYLNLPKSVVDRESLLEFEPVYSLEYKEEINEKSEETRAITETENRKGSQ